MSMTKFQIQGVQFNKQVKTKAGKFTWNRFKSPQLRRLFYLLNFSMQSSNERISSRLIEIHNDISKIYNQGNPCFGECLGRGETGITHLFETERDYDKLLGYWSAWRNVTGRKIRKLFIERMKLENIGAKENGYSDSASFELEKEFEEGNFNETVYRLYRDILPLYTHLHGYVRYCLSRFYGGRFDPTGALPAHIFGNVWAQQWNNILPIIQQCRGRSRYVNVQEEVNRNLRRKTVNDMFHIGDEFYTSIGLEPMTKEFWERSVLQQPPNTLVDCHGSAHDFSNGRDFRIKMCTERNVNDFTTIHHEMGHVQYFMAYRHQPFTFQDSPNTGFHEAIGDTIALSVKTPEHLHKIGLLSNLPSGHEFDIDYLLATALEKVVFLPFAMTMASYVWGVYNGSVAHSSLNEHWWHLHYRFQGLKPPIERTKYDFDPGAKYHVAVGESYVKYFASYIHQFQFYEALCRLKNSTVPLHRCDFYQSTLAGKKLHKMMMKGRSMHWRRCLELLTGTRDISSKSLLTYFKPLFNWLKLTNEMLNIPIGW